MENTQLLAKFSEKTGKKQTLLGHTVDCLKILKCYFEQNEKIIEQFCKRQNIDKQTFMRNLFVAVYLHDIGKLTKEFQKRIDEGRHSQQYPHAFYGFPIVWDVFKKQFQEFVYSNEPLIETLSILAHHTQLYDGIYDSTKIKEATLLKEAIVEFLNRIKDIYNKLEFNKFFELKWKEVKETDLPYFKYFIDKDGKIKKDVILSFIHPKRKTPKSLRTRVNEIVETNPQEIYRLKSLYSYFLSILKICDCYASVEFSEYVVKKNPEEEILGDILESPEKYILSIPTLDEKQILRGNTPYEFQKQIKEKSPQFCLLFAPCGRGKTEGALLWAIEVCKKRNRNKIVFAMPTQTTSNAMRDRFIELLSKAEIKNAESYVGLYHGKSLVKLEEEKVKERELDEDELSEEDVEEIKGENFKGNVFFKPITVTTIDHLILSFVHGFPQADFALGNLQNAVIVFDEVHYYERQTLKHLADLFKILRKMKIPHLLMSGTLPSFLIERISKDAKEENVSYELIEDEEGLNYTPFKLERYESSLITKENVNEEILNEITRNFKKGLNQFVILNTVEKAQKVFRMLKKRLNGESTKNIFLLHSQFTYKDRNSKEEEIIKLLKNKERKNPIILVATQIIEISLDISCDLMYTELAPPDALGQRGGRINRGNKNWKDGVKEYIIKVFRPENELPYDKDIIQKTNEFLESGIYSYLKLKEVCDMIYENEYLEKFEEAWNPRANGIPLLCLNAMNGVFKKNCLFGLSPTKVVFDEETGNAFIIRPEKQQKFEVIPWIYYQNNKRNLKVENQAKVPLWWIFRDEKEHGEDNLQWFERVEKEIGRKHKIFWICKLPYDREYGFNSSLINEAAPVKYGEYIV